eukprot:scaffold202887_cov13-Tisochrysis_lutea.AAC.1
MVLGYAFSSGVYLFALVLLFMFVAGLLGMQVRDTCTRAVRFWLSAVLALCGMVAVAAGLLGMQGEAQGRCKIVWGVNAKRMCIGRCGMQ